jgi:hypothetical protein
MVNTVPPTFLCPECGSRWRWDFAADQPAILCPECGYDRTKKKILREAFPERPEPAKDARELGPFGVPIKTYTQGEPWQSGHIYILRGDEMIEREARLARPEPSSGEPHLPWRDSLEIAIAECTKLQRYLASESAVRREAQARAEKAEGEAKALRGLLEKWAVFTEYMARDDAPLAPGTARLFDEVSTATRAALAQGEGASK